MLLGKHWWHDVFAKLENGKPQLILGEELLSKNGQHFPLHAKLKFTQPSKVLENWLNCPSWRPNTEKSKSTKKKGWKTGSISPCFAPQNWKSQASKFSGKLTDSCPKQFVGAQNWKIETPPKKNWVKNGQHFPLLCSQDWSSHSLDKFWGNDWLNFILFGAQNRKLEKPQKNDLENPKKG